MMPPEPVSTPIIELVGVTKRFGSIVANDALDLAFHPGQVHVVLGENGAGKSTLVGLLSGLLQPDVGSLRIDSQARLIPSPRAALAYGIGTVFQHSMLIPSLTVAEHLDLGKPWWQRIDRAALADRFRARAHALNITVDPNTVVRELSLGQQQEAEVVRVLLRGIRLLVLDEVTSMATPDRVHALGRLIRGLAADGLAVLFITHKLDEAHAFGDCVSVLRRGRKVGEIGPKRLAMMDQQAATSEIVRLMFGATTAVGFGKHRLPARDLRPILEVRGLTAPGLVEVDLNLAPGQILGVAGIDGNGQQQLAEALAGQLRLTKGTIRLGGRRIDRLGVGARRHLGLRYVTDDRFGEGTVATLSVAINLLLKQIGEPPFWRHGFERARTIAQHAQSLVAAFDIRTPTVATPVGRLSGGNVQKLLLARELTSEARVVVYNKPTHGLDVHNTLLSHQRIRNAARNGVATLLISTDLEELLELSDTIVVMAGGRVIGLVVNGEDAREQVGELMVRAAG